jgi:prolyl-tRNA editing enzyme YbaK/EbsC (Cys-tRNA(Pro) deacylase)
MKDALDVHRSLLAREIPHEVIRLPRVVLSADEIPDALGLPPERCVAVRLYRADNQMAGVIVRVGATPHPGGMLAALGARTLRIMPAEEVNSLTDFAAPLVSPVLLPDSVRVVADACIGHTDVVYAPTGDSGTVLGISSRWLLTASRAVVAELCLPAAPAIDLATTLNDDTRQLAQRLRDWR